MVRAPQRAGGALLDQLHPGNRLLSTPERGGPGRTTQHGPLLGPGLPHDAAPTTHSLYPRKCVRFLG